MNTNIKLFEDIRVRVKWDEKQEKWYFSIVDVVSILTENDFQEGRNYWYRRDPPDFQGVQDRFDCRLYGHCGCGPAQCAFALAASKHGGDDRRTRVAQAFQGRCQGSARRLRLRLEHQKLQRHSRG